MVVLTVDEVLLGPRGRGLCLAVACSLSEQVSRGRYADHKKLIRGLEDLDPTPVAAWGDPLAFLEPLDQSVSNAMYWQEPHQEDVVAADPGVVAALRPTAEAVMSSPATAWWSAPLDLTALRYTSRYDHQDPVCPPALTGARDRLERWRADTLADEHRAATERRADANAPSSGEWWSTPAGASVVTTTRSLPGLGSTELAWEEDSFGQNNAAIWPLTATREPRVWEIDRPQSWVQLVDRYPLDVTHARRHDWYRTTGRVGAWRIPDWDAVATEWDAVHLSVTGYLTTATRALPLAGGEGATVLAGWDPDQTWWLNDMLAATNAGPEWWRNANDPDGPALAWHRVSR